MSEITNINQLDVTKYYTYEDYKTWKFEDRVELYYGQLYPYGPTPNTRHQSISGNIIAIIGNYCYRYQEIECYHAPLDVRLPISRYPNSVDTVVQPDIVVICDPSILDEQGCNSAPDIVIEILSPGNSRKDMKEKFELYEASKISEYWMVDPGNEDIIVYTINDQNKYIGSKPFVISESVPSSVLNELKIPVGEIFRK